MSTFEKFSWKYMDRLPPPNPIRATFTSAEKEDVIFKHNLTFSSFETTTWTKPHQLIILRAEHLYLKFIYAATHSEHL